MSKSGMNTMSTRRDGSWSGCNPACARSRLRGLAPYRQVGRWFLAAAVLGGSRLSQLTDVPETALMAVLALLAGGAVLNVLKEELPDRRGSRFSAFVLGTVGYAAVLQIV